MWLPALSAVSQIVVFNLSSFGWNVILALRYLVKQGELHPLWIHQDQNHRVLILKAAPSAPWSDPISLEDSLDVNLCRQELNFTRAAVQNIGRNKAQDLSHSYSVDQIVYFVGDTVVKHLPCRPAPDPAHVQTTHQNCFQIHFWLAQYHCWDVLFTSVKRFCRENALRQTSGRTA